MSTRLLRDFWFLPWIDYHQMVRYKSDPQILLLPLCFIVRVYFEIVECFNEEILEENCVSVNCAFYCPKALCHCSPKCKSSYQAICLSGATRWNHVELGSQPCCLTSVWDKVVGNWTLKQGLKWIFRLKSQRVCFIVWCTAGFFSA